MDSLGERQKRAKRLIRGLRKLYADADCALDHQNALQLLVATILSAQCTDERVNKVTPKLFARYPDARAYADADPDELEELVRTTGFFRNKARSLKGLGQALVADHEGQVPSTMAELHALPGVGRKTANVVLGSAFGIDEGVVVDTHVQRLSGLLGLTAQRTPEKIELDLMDLVPKDHWTLWSHLLILHGRNVCKARRPLCDQCVLLDLCPSAAT